MLAVSDLVEHCRRHMSPEDVERLVGWLAWRTGRNQALADGLDTGSEEGRLVGEVLSTVATWVPLGVGPQARRARAARRAGRPSSTPPEVAERIRAMRSEGMTLQAICDTLDAEGVPTPRGGQRWRPTSLRAVLRDEGAPV